MEKEETFTRGKIRKANIREFKDTMRTNGALIPPCVVRARTHYESTLERGTTTRGAASATTSLRSSGLIQPLAICGGKE